MADIAEFSWRGPAQGAGAHSRSGWAGTAGATLPLSQRGVWGYSQRSKD